MYRKPPFMIRRRTLGPARTVASQPGAERKLLREALPSMEHKVYEKAVHNLPWEQPERVAQDAIEFVP
jgi:pimeloyl-ACP methyl ester carboxylesterase